MTIRFFYNSHYLQKIPMQSGRYKMATSDPLEDFRQERETRSGTKAEEFVSTTAKLY
jgi:hypothetical protein